VSIRISTHPGILQEAEGAESARTDAGANQSRFRRTHGAARVLGRGPRAAQDIVGERARRAGAVGRTRTDLRSPRVDAKFRDSKRSADRGAACTYHERRSSGALSAHTFLKQAQPGAASRLAICRGTARFDVCWLSVTSSVIRLTHRTCIIFWCTAVMPIRS